MWPSFIKHYIKKIDGKEYWCTKMWLIIVQSRAGI